jgi:hypothetical protein
VVANQMGGKDVTRTAAAAPAVNDGRPLSLPRRVLQEWKDDLFELRLGAEVTVWDGRVTDSASSKGLAIRAEKVFAVIFPFMRLK